MRTPLAMMAAVAIMATGCKKKPATETDTPVDTDTEEPTGDTGESCGNTPPVLANLAVANNSSGNTVSLAFTLTGSDADGDLHEVYYDLWIDDAVDGTVNTSGPAPLTGGPAIVTQNGNPVDPCSVSQGVGLTITLPIDGTNIPFDTELDFAWKLGDAVGNRSNALAITAWTPKANGDDGGPVDTDDTDTDIPVPTGDTGTPPGPTGDTGTPPPPPGPTGDTGDTGSQPPPDPTADTGSSDTSTP
ncbi:MAG: hypothetical protein H6737_18440 [Alphaproteobacteria bacterium]|nr:hypothetical protein [Alphaproteobacteria bacterium]